MRHLRGITIPRRGAMVATSESLGYLTLAILALMAGLTIGLKPSETES